MLACGAAPCPRPPTGAALTASVATCAVGHGERLPLLTREGLKEFATIPAKDLRHTRVAQEWIEEGRQEGEAKVALHQLDRRCGPLSNATTARNQALLDFSGPSDLAAWLAEHGG